MTTPDADLALASMAAGEWARCEHVDEATGLRCDYLGEIPHREHGHAVYDPRDLDVPPWHRRIVSFSEAARIAEADRG